MKNYYAKLWTAGRNTQWANGGGDVATVYSYRTAALRDRAVSEYPTHDMEAITAAEARGCEPEMMVLIKNGDVESFDRADHYESAEIGDQFEIDGGEITIIG